MLYTGANICWRWCFQTPWKHSYQSRRHQTVAKYPLTLHRFEKPPCLLKRHITAPSKGDDDQSQSSDWLSPLNLIWSQVTKPACSDGNTEVNWRYKEQWNLKEERAYHAAPASYPRASTDSTGARTSDAQNRDSAPFHERQLRVHTYGDGMESKIRWDGVRGRSREGSGDGGDKWCNEILERSEEAWRDGALRKAEGEVLRAACPPTQTSENAGGRDTGR